VIAVKIELPRDWKISMFNYMLRRASIRANVGGGTKGCKKLGACCHVRKGFQIEQCTDNPFCARHFPDIVQVMAGSLCKCVRVSQFCSEITQDRYLKYEEYYEDLPQITANNSFKAIVES